MLSPVTVRAAHKDLGKPADDASVESVIEQYEEEVGTRTDAYFTQFVNEWKAENPDQGSVIPGEALAAADGRAMRQAEEEVMEEWFNGPIRTLMERKVERGEDGW